MARFLLTISFALIVACSPAPTPSTIPETPTVTPSITATKIPTVTLTPTPEIPDIFVGTRITYDYLIENGNIILGDQQKLQPKPIFIPYRKGVTIVPNDYAGNAYSSKELDLREALLVLKYAIAQGSRQGTDGGVTYFLGGLNDEYPAFSGLSIYREPASINEYKYTIKEGFPSGLVIRDGSGISVVGKASNGDIVIAFEEYLSRTEDGYSPITWLAFVPPSEFDRISSQFLPNLKYFIGDDFVTFADNGVDRRVDLNTIDEEMTIIIRDDIGAVWLDSPSKGELMPEPVVPYPKEELLQGRNKNEYSYTVQTDNSRDGIDSQFIEAVSPDGQRTIYAVYDQETHDWIWVEGFKTDSWSTDENGLIVKEVMADVVNKALIPDKFSFDMHFGTLTLAVVEDEDLSQADAQILTERRNQAKAELESENSIKNQLLQTLLLLRTTLNRSEFDFEDCTAVIERDYNGNMQVTNIIVGGVRLFMSNSKGELTKISKTTSPNGEFYGLDKPIPMYPELKEEDRTFFFSSNDHMTYEYLPPVREDSRIIIVNDPTEILGGKVFQSEILSKYIPDDGILKLNDRHISFYPGRLRDPFNPPHGPEIGDTRWNLPIVMYSTIYIDEVEPDVGVNVHALGPEVAGKGKQIYALAGDFHVPYPGLPPDYHEDRPATNTLLAQQDGKWYILPMTHEQATRNFFVGPFVNLNASIPEKQWVQFKTIATRDGIWTLVRLYGQNRYRVMGYIENKNPDMPGYSGNFGPYALPSVSSFRAYQRDLNVASWGDRLYFPQGGPRP